MLYLVNNILRDVRIAIDENMQADALLDASPDALMLDDLVRSKVEEAVRRVIIKAPVHLLDGGVPFGDAIYWRNQASGWILLPDDFLRLIVFKMSDWERPVYVPITAADPEYQLQHSRYKGIRGNTQKPVVAICTRQEGRVLEFYSSNDDSATVEQALYMAYPVIDELDGIMIPERCYRSAIYETASLVFATFGQADKSTIFTELGNQLLV